MWGCGTTVMRPAAAGRTLCGSASSGGVAPGYCLVPLQGTPPRHCGSSTLRGAAAPKSAPYSPGVFWGWMRTSGSNPGGEAMGTFGKCFAHTLGACQWQGHKEFFTTYRKQGD
jgi:hypothetical protein